MDRVSVSSSAAPAPQAAGLPPVDAASWLRIEAGLLQRMQLLERLLADCYGPQHLLAARLLPPALVHGHPGFLRSLRGVTPVGGRFLHLAAFDLARDPQGQWWVADQRTQGAGAMGGPPVQRALEQQLRALLPAQAEPTRLVHLEAGTGGDLCVRGERLYQASAGSLLPVHGLVNALEDACLDPLELRADSRLGVPGLLQALRAGHLLVANAPGSALLESPGLAGFLPGLCAHLLGEPLSLHSLDSWWCGEAAALEAVLPQLARHQIRATYGGPDEAPVAGEALSADQLQAWAERLRQAPEDFTVQAPPPSPLLRVLALTDGASGWRVLPAGA